MGGLIVLAAMIIILVQKVYCRSELARGQRGVMQKFVTKAAPIFGCVVCLLGVLQDV